MQWKIHNTSLPIISMSEAANFISKTSHYGPRSLNVQDNDGEFHSGKMSLVNSSAPMMYTSEGQTV